MHLVENHPNHSALWVFRTTEYLNIAAPTFIGTTHKEPSIAKRRKPRPTGPPPAKSPKASRADAPDARAKAAKKSGEPLAPSLRSVVKRAGFIVGAYVLVLVFLLHVTALLAISMGVLGLAIMIPMGLLLDRWRYRAAMRKWSEGRAGAR